MLAGTMRQSLKALPFFLVGFVLVAFLLSFIPRNKLFLYAEERSEKLVELESMKGTANVAAFGSSHIHHGFDPRTFDRIFKAGSETVKSVNLAIQGGSQTEQRKMALAYLSSMQKQGAVPKYVLLELTAGVNFTGDHLVHPRSINIYDFDTLRFAANFSDSAASKSQKFGRVGFAVAAWTLYSCNVGMVSNVFFHHDISKKILEEDTKNDQRGLLVKQPTEKNLSDVAELLSKPAPSPQSRNVSVSKGSRLLVEELYAFAKKAFGAENCPRFVYIVPPLIADRNHIPNYPDSIKTSFGDVEIVNAARIDQYPELFQSSMWLDRAHLSEEGAARLTQIVVSEMTKREGGSHAIR